MIYYLIIGFLCCIAFLVIILNIRANKKIKSVIKEKEEIENLKREEIQRYFKEDWIKEKERLEFEKHIWEDDFTKYQNEVKNKYKLDASKYEGEIKQLDVQLKEKEARYAEVNQDLDLYKEGKIKEINNANDHYKEIQKLLIDEELSAYRKRWTNEINDDIAKINDQRTDMLKDLDAIKSILEDERSKRAAINEELRKTEEKEKYNEIHSVQLTDNEKEDIRFLLSLEDRLHNKQALYKLVWSTYLQQAYKNTFHNILGNRDPRNVIYCIENIETGKKYIGKTSAEVSKRWTEHIKTSLNIGTVKTTNIHKALYNHWDEFIFYILAETEKDKLSEMEKYYINFYESDKYGYNIKAGG